MLSFQQQTPSGTQQNNPTQQQQPTQQDHQANVHHLQQQQQPPTIQTMRLREDPPAITPAPRTSRKRKSPPTTTTDPPQHPAQPPPPPPPAQQPLQHVLPPPHALMHPLANTLPPGYSYAPADYTPGGMPPNLPPHGVQQQQQQQQHQSQSPPPNSAGGRALSSSKRAEQNRKAQRAFRERRDQHVKALESRSQLLDAALASADEANRRWEECRALVDQLRVENAALRAALSQAQMLPQNATNPNPAVNNNGAHAEEAPRPEVSDQLKTNSAEASSEKKE